jgi:hypothetical protein
MSLFPGNLQTAMLQYVRVDGEVRPLELGNNEEYCELEKAELCIPWCRTADSSSINSGAV